MISQLQNLRAFVTNHLIDIVDWGRDVRPDEQHKTTGDAAFIVIKTPFNRYRLSVLSSYIEPPAGAPVQCRSLGTVTFDDAADSKHIIGPKSDAVYAEISKHIHMREYSDAIAAGKRELAEAQPPTRNEDGSIKYDPAAGVRTKLAERIANAKKWGIDAAASAPMPPPLPPPAAIGLFEQSAIVNPHAIGVPVLVGDGDKPWLGMPVLFVTNPSEQISGMHRIPGQCVKVLSDDRVSMFMTPDHSEPSYRDNLPRRGSSAGDGKVHQFNCWEPNPEFVRLFGRMRKLEEAFEAMHERLGNADLKTLTELANRVAALESAERAAFKAQDKAKKTG